MMQKFFCNYLSMLILLFLSASLNGATYFGNQADLRNSIAIYLRYQRDKAESRVEKENRQKMIDFFTKGDASVGVCYGLALLWSYGKRLSDEVASPTKMIRDDSDFFIRAYDALTSFDKAIPLDRETEELIERFMTIVLLFQDGFKLIEDDDFDVEDMSGAKIDEIVFYLKSVYSFDYFLNTITYLVKPHLMITVGNQTHAISLYRSSITKKLYGYDANCEDEFESDSYEELARWAWDRFNEDKKRDSLHKNLRILNFSIYVGAGDKIPYPVDLFEEDSLDSMFQKIDITLNYLHLVEKFSDDDRIKSLSLSEKQLKKLLLMKLSEGQINKVLSYIFESGFEYSENFLAEVTRKYPEVIGWLVHQ